MMVKFTNAHDDHRGNVLYINTKYIVAVYEEASTTGGSLSTKIYGSDTVWTVEESLNQVMSSIDKPIMLVE